MRCIKLFTTLLAGSCLACAIIHFSIPKNKSDEAPLGDGTHSIEPVIPKLTSSPLVPSTPETGTTASRFLATDPEDTNGRFAAFLDNLCRSGQYQSALALASDASANLQVRLLKIIFTRWAQSHPEEAVKSLRTIANPELHSAALRALADGWNNNNPGELAAYAFALPANSDRDYALDMALNNWSQQDPAALGEWLNTLPRGTEFDNGAALMLQKTDAVNRPPELAMAWVENITDPVLKQDAFQHVFTEWIQSDPVSAEQYITTASWLSESQRRRILESFSAPPKTLSETD